MARTADEILGGQNIGAFLDMIAYSELGPKLLSLSDDGYNVIVGSTPEKPILFCTYVNHPHRLVTIRPGLVSSAAGRYQLLAKYFDAYRSRLDLQDFSPRSQDLIAVQQIKESDALEDIISGEITKAISKCAHIWASLPGAGYGQHENKLDSLIAAYTSAGGKYVG